MLVAAAYNEDFLYLVSRLYTIVGQTADVMLCRVPLTYGAARHRRLSCSEPELQNTTHLYYK